MGVGGGYWKEMKRKRCENRRWMDEWTAVLESQYTCGKVKSEQVVMDVTII
jgi:hypothetical protein